MSLFSERAKKIIKPRREKYSPFLKENRKPCQGCGYNDPLGCLRVGGCWVDEEKEI